MNKFLTLVFLMLLGLGAGAQELHCTFTQNKTLKALNKVIPGKGTVTFKAPDQLEMIYSEPQGEYLIIEGDQMRSCVKGKEIKFDTSRNARMRKMRNTLLDCINGSYEKAAKDNDATLVVEDKGKIKSVAILAKKQEMTGYSKILIDYDKKGLPVRLVLDEFTGISTEYIFTY